MKKNNRNCVLAVKVTAEEKKRIMEYTKNLCVNMSALVRMLLFNQMKKDTK